MACARPVTGLNLGSSGCMLDQYGLPVEDPWLFSQTYQAKQSLESASESPTGFKPFLTPPNTTDSEKEQRRGSRKSRSRFKSRKSLGRAKSLDQLDDRSYDVDKAKTDSPKVIKTPLGQRYSSDTLQAHKKDKNNSPKVSKFPLFKRQQSSDSLKVRNESPKVTQTRLPQIQSSPNLKAQNQSKVAIFKRQQSSDNLKTHSNSPKTPLSQRLSLDNLQKGDNQEDTLECTNSDDASFCSFQNGDAKDYQLWVISDREDAPYPLFGEYNFLVYHISLNYTLVSNTTLPQITPW